ncbi:hypothetical protein AV530_008230 [Patagioenas fasciata monilis]|uniref:Uncharacterized protein n=1 Tax=Patagioenas fasciata monilis TaxID=372326 RepID=A0A1V4KUZ4_PATFA|nr:hypothetical protein AV530_008230 [Patagioenas fasciata monilis]
MVTNIQNNDTGVLVFLARDAFIVANKFIIGIFEGDGIGKGNESPGRPRTCARPDPLGEAAQIRGAERDLNVTQSIPKSACRSSPVSSVALIGSHAAFEELGCSTHEGNLLHLQQQPLLLLMLWYAVRMRFTLELLHWPE